MVKVYLAGPINGCDDAQAKNWREQAKELLGVENCIDPMRRDYRGREGDCVKEIVDGDLQDIQDCDAVLANCWQVSWGTAMEIFHASSIGKPVYVVLPPETRVSPWLAHHATVCQDWQDAFNQIDLLGSEVIDAAHLIRQREWSERTFGPGDRTLGVVDHIRKELIEVLEDPSDLSEWADVIILALDGAWRTGREPQEVIDAVIAKQTRNEERQWPDWRTAPLDQAIEHLKETVDAP